MSYAVNLEPGGLGVALFSLLVFRVKGLGPKVYGHYWVHL